MSRSISIWYEKDNASINIDVGNKDLLGTQEPSLEFWGMQSLKDFGIAELTNLGITDPVYFTGWEELNKLELEIILLELNFDQIDYHEETKKRWIENLRFCYEKLVKLAPPESVPKFMIG